MKEIKLTRGMVTLVDDADFEYLNSIKWYATKSTKDYYAKNGKLGLMHRVLLGLKKRYDFGDHIDCNTLNNQRHNLRVVSPSDSAKNRRGYGRSQYIGVSFHITKWQASIKNKNKYTHLGLFNNEIDAAKAYDDAAIKFHGEFANLNFKK